MKLWCGALHRVDTDVLLVQFWYGHLLHHQAAASAAVLQCQLSVGHDTGDAKESSPAHHNCMGGKNIVAQLWELWKQARY